jgi:hypothetical protein
MRTAILGCGSTNCACVYNASFAREALDRRDAEITRYRAGLQKIVDADGWWDAPSLARDLLAGKDVT